MSKQIFDDPNLLDRFDHVLSETVEAMEEAGIKYLFIGGIASGGLGRPRSTRDIDLFVMPEDAEAVLRALSKHGFRTEKTDPAWLYKGFKEDILVDVIFKSKGEIYLDPEMVQRVIVAEFHGKKLRLVSPEDLLIIKAAAHGELTPSHWHDAIALLSYANMDWNYLVRRARRAPRRVLSLMLYAQSNDVWVPNSIIHELYAGVFGSVSPGEVPRPPRMVKVAPQVNVQPGSSMSSYKTAHVRERLAEDPRTNELDIEIEESGGKIVLKGEVQQKERRDAVEEVTAEFFPLSKIENRIKVTHYPGPTEESSGNKMARKI